MIARISSGAYVKGMVLYNANKVNEGAASLINTNNIFDSSTNGILKTLQAHNSQNPNIKKPNMHISLNFHHDDNLTTDDLKNIADHYMQDMGYEEQPYAVYQHFDASHTHLHIVSTRIALNGLKLNDSYEYRKSVRVTEEIEKEYKLVIAKDQSSGKKIPNPVKLVNKYIETGKGDLLNLIDQVLYSVINQQPKNEKEFLKFLSNYNVSYYLNEDTKGITYYTYKDNFDSSNSLVQERVGKTIKASDTTKGLLYNDLKQLFERNSKYKKSNLKSVRGRIFHIHNGIGEGRIPLEAFRTLLIKKGIKLNVLRARSGEKEGTIIGVSFTDLKSGFKYTGEEVKLKWKSLSNTIVDDKSDLQTSNSVNEKVLIKEIENFDLMSELEKILAHQELTANDYQEDLRKKKRKKNKL